MFNKELVPLRVSKEDTTRVELGEIKQRTVVDFTVQELLPQVDKHHPRDREILGFGDSNLLINYTLLGPGFCTMGTDRHTTPGRGPRHGHRSRRGKGNTHNGRTGLLWTYNGIVIP